MCDCYNGGGIHLTVWRRVPLTCLYNTRQTLRKDMPFCWSLVHEISTLVPLPDTYVYGVRTLFLGYNFDSIFVVALHKLVRKHTNKSRGFQKIWAVVTTTKYKQVSWHVARVDRISYGQIVYVNQGLVYTGSKFWGAIAPVISIPSLIPWRDHRYWRIQPLPFSMTDYSICTQGRRHFFKVASIGLARILPGGALFFPEKVDDLF